MALEDVAAQRARFGGERMIRGDDGHEPDGGEEFRLEECDAKREFERLDALADGGLHSAEAPRSRRKAASLDNSRKHAQLVQRQCIKHRLSPILMDTIKIWPIGKAETNPTFP